MNDLFLFIYYAEKGELGFIVVSESFNQALVAFKEAGFDLDGFMPLSENQWAPHDDILKFPFLMREPLKLNQVYII